jgi:hypothetical protein
MLRRSASRLASTIRARSPLEVPLMLLLLLLLLLLHASHPGAHLRQRIFEPV